jgi:hypothetical protein
VFEDNPIICFRSRQFREIRFSHSNASASGAAPHAPDEEYPSTSSSSTDDALRGRLFERAEHEALNNMIMSSSVTGLFSL